MMFINVRIQHGAHIHQDKVGIIEPSKGKKVNQAEFDGIQDKKAKEMMERFQNNRSGDGKGIEIRIGG